MGGDHQSVKPSSMPTSQPTSLPSQLPSVSKSPSQFPSAKPSVNPSLMPSLRPSVCQNDSNWRVGGSSRYKAMTCEDIESDPVKWCTFLENPINAVFNDKRVSDACCECGGGEHHSITPTSVPSSGPTKSILPSSLQSLIPTLNPSSPPTECRDEPGWTFTSKSGVELGCKGLEADPVKLCEVAGSIDYQSKPAKLACCVSSMSPCSSLFVMIIILCLYSPSYIFLIICNLRFVWAETISR